MPRTASKSHTIKNPDIDVDLAKFEPRQMEAVKALDSGFIKYLLYGGALGGGKSYFLRWYAVRRLIVLYNVFGISHAVGMLACEDYPSLKDRQLQKIGQEFPAWLGRMHADHREYGRCFILNKRWGSGVICFRNLDDPSKYQSAEFAFILVDELTKNDYDTFTFLRSRLRWPGLPDIECQFAGGTNPGGVGHGWVKQLWMDKLFGEEWYPPAAPHDYRTQFTYIPSKASDNPHLDPGYWAVLNTLPENLRAAFRDGDWDIFVGQAFSEFSRLTHVIEPIPIPEYAPLYMTYDWGYGAPFSIGWWWVDQDGRVYRFAEWYGWNGQPNQGLRMTDTAVAKQIVAREAQMRNGGILDKSQSDFIRICDPTSQNKKPDYKGGGQGPSTIEEFAKEGVFLSPGDANRALKIRQFHLRLEVPKDGTMPMMMIYNTCEQFIRCLPNIVIDKNKIEDVDTDSEDHIYDEAAHICMARPLALKNPTKQKSFTDRRIEELYRPKADEGQEMFGREDSAAWHNLGVNEPYYGDEIPVDDGALTRTIR